MSHSFNLVQGDGFDCKRTYADRWSYKADYNRSKWID